tara:strand:+ start:2498 stop:2701 length:204 start_codon:yes stop_codon:yes gene_type:complete
MHGILLSLSAKVPSDISLVFCQTFSMPCITEEFIAVVGHRFTDADCSDIARFCRYLLLTAATGMFLA